MIIKKLFLTKEKVIEINNILSSETFIPKYDPDGIIEVFTIKFDNNLEVDIKVCNGNSPYLDVVIFDKGAEVNCFLGEDNILGEYDFEYNGEKYQILIKEGN